MSLAFRIALRFLSHSRGQSAVIALGIAVGVAVQVFIGALIIGLQQGLIEKTVGNSPHITITAAAPAAGISGWKSVEATVRRADAEVARAFASADSPAFALSGSQAKPIVVRGLQAKAAAQIYGLAAKVYAGRSRASATGVLLGRELAEELKLMVGDSLTIGTPGGVRRQVAVDGLYDLKVASLNRSWVVATMGFAQSLFGMGDTATSVEAQVDDIFSADVAAASVAAALKRTAAARTATGAAPGELKVDDWKAQNEQLLSGLKGQSISSGMIQVCVLLAVVLGIASILAMTVMQKSRQIGILKAMGLTDSQSSFIFLVQGLILGAAGTALGMGLGLGLGFAFTKFAVGPDGTPVANLLFSPSFVMVSAASAMLASAAASLIPAQKSRRLSPVEVIRNG